jgi:hypothetical protein
VLRTTHWATDTALWNVQDPSPATGQAIEVRLMGCAQPTPGAELPLTQIHIQDVSPIGGGGVHVNLTSQAFDIPICGVGGAGPSTISTYKPINLCVAQGDYVDFNDEGGFVPYVYQSGVPYQVISDTPGSVMDSFIRANGTDNGNTLGASDRSNMDGFAANQGEELAMQVTLGTGPDSTFICPGGTAGKPAALPVIRVSPQTDGVNHSGVVSVAIYCRTPTGCPGSAQLTAGAAGTTYAKTNFQLPGNKTSHLPLHLDPRLLKLIHRSRHVSASITASSGGTIAHQRITIQIF